jgi:predicted SAM-dependent methyltransferase
VTSTAVAIGEGMSGSAWPRLPVTRLLVDQVGLELASLATRASYLCLPWRRSKLRDVRTTPDTLVNVACGSHIQPQFLNIDLFPCASSVFAWDCRRSLPLATRTAAGIRAEHFVERLDPRVELPAFLADARRALRPGAVLRIVAADAERYVRAYVGNDAAAFEELVGTHALSHDPPTRMDVLNQIFYHGQRRRWAYDFDTLAQRLRAAGFVRVERMAFKVSLDPRLACDRDRHAAWSLYVDAIAP